MPSGDQFVDQIRADEARSTGDETVHAAMMAVYGCLSNGKTVAALFCGCFTQKGLTFLLGTFSMKKL